MTVLKLSEYANAPKTRIPLTITFFGPKFHKPDGTDFSVTVRVTVEDGNVFGILNQVQEEGGIGKLEGGRYTFLPWPCACVGSLTGMPSTKTARSVPWSRSMPRIRY